MVPVTDPSPEHVIVPSINHDNSLEHIAVLHSCNGLLLCYTTDVRRVPAWQPILPAQGLIYSSGKSLGVTRPHSVLLVCNPTTKQFVVFGFPDHVKDNHYEDPYYLSFEPLSSPHFKVVSILRVNNDNAIMKTYQARVYSSNTGSWSDSVIEFDMDGSISVKSGVYCKNAIHWCSGQYRDQCSYVDIERQCMEVLQMPSRESKEVLHFGESGGHLQLILVRGYQELEFDVLEVKEDYSSWSSKYHVNANRLPLAFPNLNWDSMLRFKMLHVLYVGEQTMIVLLNSVAVCYNFVDSTSTIVSTSISWLADLVPLKYCQSLASFHGALDHN